MQLRTVHQVVVESDANGVAAFYEPGLMERDVWFGTRGPPWEMDPDWLGFTGATLSISAGGSATVTVRPTGTPGPCEATDEASRLITQGLPPLEERHGIRIVDAASGRGVPMAEVRASGRFWVSDSAGLVAVVEPDALDGTSTLSIRSHGYVARSTVVTLDRGGRSTVELQRRMPSERLYRVTGAGIYRDSVLLAEPTPLLEPLLTAQVAGLDSTHTAVHDGRLFWVWGDTLRPSYPLGHFKTAGATSPLPGSKRARIAPDVGIDLTYFVGDDGFSRPVAPVADEGLVWTSGLVSLGADLIGTWVNVDGADDDPVGGLVVWDDAREEFAILTSWMDPLPAEPSGTAFVERERVYFTDIGGDDGAFRVVRAEADLESLADPSTYATWTAHDGTDVVRSGGQPVYAWRPAAPPTTGLARPEHMLHGHLRDPLADTDVGDHIGSVFWNEHVGRYVRISARPWGDDAFLGETWLALGDTPMGPWAWAQKVATHDDYSFYNPRHHPEFDDGSLVQFEGTYSATFSDADAPTPRYDYNQIMHRVDLDALVLPVPVYGDALQTRTAMRPADLAGADAEPARFFALDRAAEGAVPMRWSGPDCWPRRLGSDGAGETAFWVLPTGASPQTVPLHGNGTSTPAAHAGGFPTTVLGAVWPNPIAIPFPVSAHPDPVAADAGPDQCADEGIVRLDGSAADPEASFRWTWSGGSSDQPFVSVVGEGVHVVTLTVTDSAGRVGSDVVVVGIGDPGCACSHARTDPPGLLLLVLLLGLRRDPRRASMRSPREGTEPRSQ